MPGCKCFSKSKSNNYKVVQFCYYLKYTFTSILILLLPIIVSAQNDSIVVRLSLNQIIDSAIANHPEIKNAELRIIAAKTHYKEIPDIKPTEIYYERGQRFSAFTDTKFEIQQNIGSPFAWKSKEVYTNNIIALQEAEAQLIKAQVVKKVKAAYYSCIYELNRLEVLKKQKELCTDSSNILTLHNKYSDTNQLDKTNAEIQLFELSSQADQSYNDYLLAKNDLIQAAYLNSDFEPIEEELKMFEIVASPDAENRVPANLFNNYYRQNSGLADATVKLENAKFYPEITAGYFNQSINRGHGFTGFQVGIVMPLWFLPQSAKKKEAIIQKQIAENEKDLQKFNARNTSEKMMIKLNKLFERLNYFYDFALKQAYLIEEIAIKKFKTNSIEYISYFQSINTAYKIRLEYLDTLNNYNQTAIELELYAY